MDDHALRNHLIELLRGGQAHITVEKSLKGLKSEYRNIQPKDRIHSIYEEIEHMRIAQEDIIRYTRDPAWKSPYWPDGYWPLNNDNLTKDIWEKTVSNFFSDLDELIKFIEDSRLDLTTQIPHGEGHTYLHNLPNMICVVIRD